MTEDDFPDGRWTGFFMQALLPGRHPMDMTLSFGDGKIRGEGIDWVGEFTIRGRYDLDTGECRWIKHYRGKHDVSYVGRNEGQGIWGVWELSQLFGLIRGRGVFHVWPRGMRPTREADLTELAMRGQVWWSPLLIALGVLIGLAALAYLHFVANN